MKTTVCYNHDFWSYLAEFFDHSIKARSQRSVIKPHRKVRVSPESSSEAFIWSDPDQSANSELVHNNLHNQHKPMVKFGALLYNTFKLYPERSKRKYTLPACCNVWFRTCSWETTCINTKSQLWSNREKRLTNCKKEKHFTDLQANAARIRNLLVW